MPSPRTILDCSHSFLQTKTRPQLRNMRVVTLPSPANITRRRVKLSRFLIAQTEPFLTRTTTSYVCGPKELQANLPGYIRIQIQARLLNNPIYSY